MAISHGQEAAGQGACDQDHVRQYIFPLVPPGTGCNVPARMDAPPCILVLAEVGLADVIKRGEAARCGGWAWPCIVVVCRDAVVTGRGGRDGR
jgi:hypothetical protein